LDNPDAWPWTPIAIEKSEKAGKALTNCLMRQSKFPYEPDPTIAALEILIQRNPQAISDNLLQRLLLPPFEEREDAAIWAQRVVYWRPHLRYPSCSLNPQLLDVSTH
jgi:hypothetical protein